MKNDSVSNLTDFLAVYPELRQLKYNSFFGSPSLPTSVSNQDAPLWGSKIKEQISITQPLWQGFEFKLMQVRQKTSCLSGKMVETNQGDGLAVPG